MKFLNDVLIRMRQGSLNKNQGIVLNSTLIFIEESPESTGLIYHLFKIAQLLSEVKKIMRRARILTVAELQYVIFPHAFFHNNDTCSWDDKNISTSGVLGWCFHYLVR